MRVSTTYKEEPHTVAPTVMQLTATALPKAKHFHFCRMYQTDEKFTQDFGQKTYSQDHLNTQKLENNTFTNQK
jgi:hypothetical protein